MTKSKKPTTAKEWEKVCDNLNKALNSMMADEENMQARLDKLEEQLTMTVGVVKYLEMKLDRLNPVRRN
jgi:ribosome assembly protein YihI (activator of Der GTPase)